MANHAARARQGGTGGLRVTGDRTQRPTVRKGQPIDSSFRHGTVRAALTVSASDRTLGKRSYRLTATAAERNLHNAVNAKRNTAEWVANPEPMAYVTADRVDSIGTESVHPRSNITPVPFEWRQDHLARGRRSDTW